MCRHINCTLYGLDFVLSTCELAPSFRAHFSELVDPSIDRRALGSTDHGPSGALFREVERKVALLWTPKASNLGAKTSGPLTKRAEHCKGTPDSS